MSDSMDKLNYIKNMIWMMCCDGDIAEREKKFLGATAKAIGAQIEDWNALMKEVVADKGRLYPINDRPKAIATLKSLVVMAKADNKLDATEKDYLRRFAKSLGLTNQQFKTIAKEIDMATLLDPFKDSARPVGTGGKFIAIKEDFAKIDDFKDVILENNAEIKISGFDEFLNAGQPDSHIVCFHTSEDKNVSIERCRHLLEKSGPNTAAILTRYQGHQVKYLHETGLKKCVIEPVYAHDIGTLLK
ncbi:MAG: TerB family tellurite resistance protein [Phycisphaerae bacterium]|nr:TerB family tellurite resistance protein [Phycisphaerae bacterium]